MIFTFDPKTFSRVLGKQLRNARRTHGWYRWELIERLQREVSEPAVGTYEQGTRHITVVRFIEICLALEESPLTILRGTCERAFGCTIDLVAAAAVNDPTLLPLRNWAANQLRANPDGPTTVLFIRPAIASLAAVCGLEPAELLPRLPRPQAQVTRADRERQ